MEWCLLPGVMHQCFTTHSIFNFGHIIHISSYDHDTFCYEHFKSLMWTSAKANLAAIFFKQVSCSALGIVLLYSSTLVLIYMSFRGFFFVLVLSMILLEQSDWDRLYCMMLPLILNYFIMIIKLIQSSGNFFFF